MKFEMSGKEYVFDTRIESERNDFLETLFLGSRNLFPFFINLLISICDVRAIPEEEKAPSIAYTVLNPDTERIDIRIDFNYVEKEKLTHIDVLYLIFHELLHNYLYHGERMREQHIKNPVLCNICEDLYVNNICDDLLLRGDKKFNKFFTLNEKFKGVNYESIVGICNHFKIKGLPHESELLKEWTEPELFKFLDKNLQGKGKGKSRGSGSGNAGVGKSIQDQIDDMSDSELEELAEKIAQSFDDHKKMHKEPEETEGQGNKNKIPMSEKMKALQAKIQNKIKAKEMELASSSGCSIAEQSIIDRKTKLFKPIYFLNTLKLLRLINKTLEQNYTKTYKRVSRKRFNETYIVKGKKKLNGNKLVVAIDVSGSISDEDLETFISLLYGLQKKKKEYSFDVIYWSSCEIKEGLNAFKNVGEIRQFFNSTKVNSSGGTEIETLHEFLNKSYQEPIEIINITDGCFSLHKTLNENILKYHFVLTENYVDKFEQFYNEKRFNIVLLKDEK